MENVDIAVVSSNEPTVVAALLSSPTAAHHRPQRRPRARGRGSPRLRGNRLVTTDLRRARSTEVGQGRRPRVLIIIQNLAVPFDRRVWLECQSLRDAGWRRHRRLSRGTGLGTPPGARRHRDLHLPAVRAGRHRSRVRRRVRLLVRHDRAPGAEGPAACADRSTSCRRATRPTSSGRWPGCCVGATARASCSTTTTCALSSTARASVTSGPPAYVGLEFLERMTFRTADRVTSTNESYAAVARRRGGKSPEHVTVVRTGPDPRRMARGPEAPEMRRGRRHLVAYIGVMGPQDGVDLAIRAAGEIVHELGRRDISFTFMGAGDSYPELVALRDRLGLQDHVELPGRVPDSFVTQVLSTADLGLCPDPMNPLNDVSTMNKTMEYMAFGLPVVAFDLRETRVSAGDSAVYVEPNDVGLFARASGRPAGPPGAALDDGPDRSRARRRRARLGAPATRLPRRLRGPRALPPRMRGADLHVWNRRHFPAARGQDPRQHDDRTHRPPRPGCVRAAGSRPTALLRDARARPPVDHRPDDRGQPAVREGLADPGLQRRAVQLPRAAGRAHRPGRLVRDPLRHRGRARGLAALGNVGPGPLPRHVRLRRARRRDR